MRLDELRMGFRAVTKRSEHTIVMVAALAASIGMLSAIFSMVESMVMRPFHFARLEQVMVVSETIADGGSERYGTSPANFIDWREKATSFGQLAAYEPWSAVLTKASGAESVDAYRVSTAFFSLVGVDPLMGTTFTPTQQDADNTLVVSYAFWKNRLASMASPVGQSLTINNRAYTIIGVMPASFVFPIGAEAWGPLALGPSERTNRTAHTLRVIGRLRANVLPGAAQAEMTSIAMQLAAEFPKENASRGAEVVPLRRSVNTYADKFLLILITAVSVLLCLACASVANLQLANAVTRRKEWALKLALGATRARVATELICENLMLSFAAAAAAIPLAYGMLRLIRLSITGAVIRNAAGILAATIDPMVLGFSTAVAIGTAVLVSLPTIRQSWNIHLNDTLNSDGRQVSGRIGRRARSLLIGTQLALATFLLILAGALVISFVNLTRTRLGFDGRGVLVCHTTLSNGHYPQLPRAAVVYDDVIRRLGELPGVVAAGAVSDLPSIGDSNPAMLSRPGQLDLSHPYIAELRVATPQYFRTMAIPLKAGRDFLPSDDAQRQQVAIVSDHVARRLWPSEDPVGQLLQLGSETTVVRVVGVAGDVNHFLLDDATRPVVYRPLAQEPTRSMYLMVRAAPTEGSLASQMRETIRESAGSDSVMRLSTLIAILTDISGGVRVLAMLMVGLGLIALALAVGGSYAVIAYVVTMQKRDIAVRVALGASRRQVIRPLLAHMLRIQIIGAAFGLVLATFLMQFLTSKVSVITLPMWIEVIVLIIMTVASLMAAIVPARKALSVDPLLAIR